jgi:tetratricopeptide (TPR) repeat protein
MARNRQQAGRSLGPEEAQRLSDEDVLAKLHGFGIALDRATLADWCAQALSAKELADALEQHARTHNPEARHSEWIWRCLATLWQRWCPEIPSFEALEATMQDGYARLAAGDVQAACRTWLDAWQAVLHLLDKAGMPTGMSSIERLDARFRGTQSLFNWIQDLEAELWNAGLADPSFLTARIQVCEEGLRRFPADDALLTENRRRAVAESYAKLGEPGKADTLYQEWLRADPRWGWGWIGWADTHRFLNAVPDVTRAEQLLQGGLAIPDVRDRADLAERLADLYDEQGRHAEANALWQQAKTAAEAAEAMEVTLDVPSRGAVARHKTTITFGGAGLPLSELSTMTDALRRASAPASIGRQKVGRNDPCPCGSGKKFKKCCGQGPSSV